MRLIKALMRWVRGDLPKPDPASEIARVFFDECVVADRISNEHDYGVPRKLMSTFNQRARLYREATGLMVLNRLAKEQQRFEPVLQAYEQLIFGKEPTPIGVKHLGEVKAAMADLSDLITANIGELSWSCRWFETIELTTINPVDIALFATVWESLFVTMYQGIESWRPAREDTRSVRQKDTRSVRKKGGRRRH